MKSVFDRDRMHDDLLIGLLLRAFFCARTRNEGDALQQRVQPIVGSRDGTFRKDDQRALGLGKSVNRHVERFAIHTFAVDAEAAHLLDREPGEPILLVQMPARHREDMGITLTSKPAHRDRISRACVIRCEQNPVSSTQRFLESFLMTTFVGHDAMRIFQPTINQPKSLDETRPPISAMRRDIRVGFFKDYVLHLAAIIVCAGSQTILDFRDWQNNGYLAGIGTGDLPVATVAKRWRISPDPSTFWRTQLRRGRIQADRLREA